MIGIQIDRNIPQTRYEEYLHLDRLKDFCGRKSLVANAINDLQRVVKKEWNRGGTCLTRNEKALYGLSERLREASYRVLSLVAKETELNKELETLREEKLVIFNYSVEDLSEQEASDRLHRIEKTIAGLQENLLENRENQKRGKEDLDSTLRVVNRSSNRIEFS